MDLNQLNNMLSLMKGFLDQQGGQPLSMEMINAMLTASNAAVFSTPSTGIPGSTPQPASPSVNIPVTSTPVPVPEPISMPTPTPPSEAPQSSPTGTPFSTPVADPMASEKTNDDLPMSESDIQAVPEGMEVLNVEPIHYIERGGYGNPIDADNPEELEKISKRKKLSRENIRKSSRIQNLQEVKVEKTESISSRRPKRSRSLIDESEAESETVDQSKKTTSANVGKSAEGDPADTGANTTTDTQSTPKTPTGKQGDCPQDDLDSPGSPYNLSSALSKPFYNVKAKDMFPLVSKRSVKSERFIDPISFKKFGMDVFLSERGLWGSVNVACPYDVDSVYELYANIPEDFGLEWRNKYGQVYVRGKIYDFDSKIINEFFGLPSVDDEVIQPSQMDEVITVLSGGKTVRWANKSNLNLVNGE